MVKWNRRLVLVVVVLNGSFVLGSLSCHVIFPPVAYHFNLLLVFKISVSSFATPLWKEGGLRWIATLWYSYSRTAGLTTQRRYRLFKSRLVGPGREFQSTTAAPTSCPPNPTLKSTSLSHTPTQNVGSTKLSGGVTIEVDWASWARTRYINGSVIVMSISSCLSRYTQMEKSSLN